MNSFLPSHPLFNLRVIASCVRICPVVPEDDHDRADGDSTDNQPCAAGSLSGLRVSEFVLVPPGGVFQTNESLANVSEQAEE